MVFSGFVVDFLEVLFVTFETLRKTLHPANSMQIPFKSRVGRTSKQAEQQLQVKNKNGKKRRRTNNGSWYFWKLFGLQNPIETRCHFSVVFSGSEHAAVQMQRVFEAGISSAVPPQGGAFSRSEGSHNDPGSQTQDLTRLSEFS